MPVPRVLVTRPAHDAAAWVQRLTEHGIAAEALPLIEITPEPPTGALAQARQRLGDYAAVMFVSGNAVTALLGSDPDFLNGIGLWPASDQRKQLLKQEHGRPVPAPRRP